MKDKKHTFAVCAYGESPYLEACVQSLKKQTTSCEILIATATPNSYIQQVADKYHVPVYVNTGDHGITQDWNFALSKVKTPYATVAHQDDVYGKHYTETMQKYMEHAKKPLIFFTDYGELRDGEIVTTNTLLKIKRLMLLPMRLSGFRGSRWIRRRVLSMGCPICCPSVTFAMNHVPEDPFQHHFRADEDWECWERLSKLKGEFLYCPKILTYHRIHEESETSKILQDDARTQEDLIMFRKFWPEKIARRLAKLYSKSEKSNEM